MRACSALLALLAGLLLVSATAAAQTNSGEIAGVVRDSQSGVLPGTRVAAASTAAQPDGLRLCGIDDDAPPRSATMLIDR